MSTVFLQEGRKEPNKNKWKIFIKVDCLLYLWFFYTNSTRRLCD
jgi:hypothetical protein